MPPQEKVKTLINSDYYSFLLNAIDKAKKSISVLMYDWRWYSDDPTCPAQQINQALVRAKKRGVSVRVVFGSCSSPDDVSSAGLPYSKYTGAGILHCKLFIVDDDLTLLGSHNLTNNALELNQEISCAVFDEGIATDVKKYFDNLWRK